MDGAVRAPEKVGASPNPSPRLSKETPHAPPHKCPRTKSKVRARKWHADRNKYAAFPHRKLHKPTGSVPIAYIMKRLGQDAITIEDACSICNDSLLLVCEDDGFVRQTIAEVMGAPKDNRKFASGISFHLKGPGSKEGIKGAVITHIVLGVSKVETEPNARTRLLTP